LGRTLQNQETRKRQAKSLNRAADSAYSRFLRKERQETRKRGSMRRPGRELEPDSRGFMRGIQGWQMDAPDKPGA